MPMPGAITAAALRPVSHETRMSAVDHLDELRARLFVCLGVVVVAFGLCFWQNHELLRIVNRPLAKTTSAQVKDGHGTAGRAYEIQRTTRDVAKQVGTLAGVVAARDPQSAEAAQLRQVRQGLARDVRKLSAPAQGEAPVTLGIGEPFTATLTVTLIFALILSLPILLLQVYGFVMPAMSNEQRRHMLPVIWAIPLLFATGVAFGYVVVLPASLHFFQNFNSGQFNVLVQASQYYKYAATILLAMGLLFQVPVAIVAAVRAGVVTPAQLRHHRRWAVFACVAVAALIPGDLVTMLLETVPLYLLFEFSIVVAAISQRRARSRISLS